GTAGVDRFVVGAVPGRSCDSRTKPEGTARMWPAGARAADVRHVLRQQAADAVAVYDPPGVHDRRRSGSRGIAPASIRRDRRGGGGRADRKAAGRSDRGRLRARGGAHHPPAHGVVWGVLPVADLRAARVVGGGERGGGALWDLAAGCGWGLPILFDPRVRRFLW